MGLYIVHSYRHRFVREDSDMVGLLPRGDDVTTFYANVDALRSAGLLGMLAGSKRVEEGEYRSFVAETGFDYSRDLEVVAGAGQGSRLFFALLGRFDSSKLRGYAATHGGGCSGEVCYLPTSTAGRWTSFLLVQPNVLAVALGESRSAVELLRPDGEDRKSENRKGEMASTQPVWVKMAPALLKNPLSLPLPLRILAVSLESANPVILSLGRPEAGSDVVFNVRLDAQCPNEPTAESIRNQMEIQTKMLKLELTREHVDPNPSDLTGLVTAGAFQVVEKRVVGTWPVRKELLKALE